MTKRLNLYQTTEELNVEKQALPVPSISYVRGSNEVYVAANYRDDVIYYTTIDNELVETYTFSDYYGTIINNTYTNGIGIVCYDKPVTRLRFLFYDNSTDNINWIKLPKTITSLSNVVVQNNNYLISIELPPTLESISIQNAFKNCTALEKIIVGKNIKKISSGFLTGTKYYNDKSNWEDGILYLNEYLLCIEDKTLSHYLIKDGTKVISCDAFSESLVMSVVLPNSLKYINEYAFYNSKLTSVTIPSGVKEIMFGAFANCSKLKDVIIENGVEIFESAVFQNCTTIQSIHIPDSVTKLGDGEGVFQNCVSLQSVRLSDNLVELGADCFNNCSQLNEIELPDSLRKIGYTPFCNSGIYNNSKYWNNGAFIISNYLLEVNKDISGEYVIQDGIKGIAYSAFGGSNLSSISIPKSVKFICQECFANCANLTNIDLGNVDIIEGSMFAGCSSLESVVFPDSVKEIHCGGEMFASSGVKRVYIGSGLEVLDQEDGVMFDYSDVEEVVVSENNKTFDSRDNCNAIIETATNTLIATCKNSFIPDGVEVIGSGAILDNFSSVTIPLSVKVIKKKAFLYSQNYYNVYYNGTRAQWNEITKEDGWNRMITSVQCTDGTVRV